MVSQKAISKRLIGTLKMPAKPHPGLSGQPAFLSLIGDRLREHGTCWIVAEETNLVSAAAAAPYSRGHSLRPR